MALNLQSTVQLNNGYAFPVFGLGTWRSDKGLVRAAVKHAILNGYRHIDAAAVYANQEEVGDGIKDALEEKKDITRADIFVTDKLWNTEHKPEHVEAACRETLAKLKLDYLDLYLIHWPTPFAKADSAFPKDADGNTLLDDTPYKDTWQALEKLVDLGLVRSIGVSNLTIDEVKDILTYARIKPVTNQVENHPYFHQAELLQYLKENNIVLTAYSPLGNVKADDPETPLTDALIGEIAKKYGKSNAQISLRWGLQVGNVVIPKSTTPARIVENADIFDFELTAEEVEQISAQAALKNKRLINPPFKAGNTTVWPKL